MGKYIIELEDNESVYKTVHETIIANEHPILQVIAPAPYTEPDLDAIRKEAFEKGYSTAVAEQECAVRGATEKAYQRGLNDAWECASKIVLDKEDGGLDMVAYCETFGYGKGFGAVLKTFTASEAVEKIRQYEQEKKEQIQVGDEVVGTYTGEEETEPFVIIRKIPEIYPPYYFGIYSKSGEFCQGGLKLKKTGRHFPEIAEVLRKMKENSDG